MSPIQASRKSNEKVVFSNLQDKNKNQNLNWEICFELQRLDQFSAKAIARTIATSFIQKPKSYTQFPHTELTIYQRDITKTY